MRKDLLLSLSIFQIFTLGGIVVLFSQTNDPKTVLSVFAIGIGCSGTAFMAMKEYVDKQS